MFKDILSATLAVGGAFLGAVALYAPIDATGFMVSESTVRALLSMVALPSMALGMILCLARAEA